MHFARYTIIVHKNVKQLITAQKHNNIIFILILVCIATMNIVEQEKTILNEVKLMMKS